MILRTILCTCVIIWSSAATFSQKSGDSLLLSQKIATIFNKLAATDTDSTKFDEFFRDWNQRSVANSAAEINNNPVSVAVYGAFRSIYQPYDLEKISNEPNPKNIPNHNPLFVTIQNKISYTVTEDSLFGKSDDLNAKETIENFRPPVNILTSKILYLTDAYKLAIDSFLDNVKYNRREVLSERSSENWNLMFKRSHRLENYIPVKYRPGGISIEAAPHVELMTFNKSLSQVIITYGIGFGGYRSLLKKSHNEWKIIRTEIAWYE